MVNTVFCLIKVSIATWVVVMVYDLSYELVVAWMRYKGIFTLVLTGVQLHVS